MAASYCRAMRALLLLRVEELLAARPAPPAARAATLMATSTKSVRSAGTACALMVSTHAMGSDAPWYASDDST